jgi:putative ABC transport system permease protein
MVSLLVFTLSFTVGVDQSIHIARERVGADIIVVPHGAGLSFEQFLLESKTKNFYMDKGILSRIKAVEGVEVVTYHTYLSTIPGVCCGVEEAQVVAFDIASDFIVLPWLKYPLEDGLRSGELLIGSNTFENLDLLEQDAFLFNMEFKIVGILEETGTGLDDSIFMLEEDAKKVFKNRGEDEDKISVVFVKVKEGYDAKEVWRKIEGSIVEVDAITRGRMGDRVKETLGNMSRVFSLIVFFSSILTVFVAWAIYSAVVNERRREIGIIRAMGANRNHVMKLFLLEALYVSSIGSLIGIFSGNYLTIFIISKFQLLHTIMLDASTKAWINVLSLSLGIIVCVFGAFFPVLKISNQDLLQSIKTE